MNYNLFSKLSNLKNHLLSIVVRTSFLWPDKIYLKMVYWLKMGKSLNLKNPKTYSEKLQWLKLFDRKPEYTMMVDKYSVKDYVASIIGEEHIIPTLGVWTKVEDIEWDSLPNQFVIKCTHDSGTVVIVKDKMSLNIDETKKLLKKWMKRNYYLLWREWPYKGIKPRIIGEEYMVDESGTELKDYKFFCFDGEPKALFIATDRSNPNEETKFDFFDMDFNHLPFTNGHPNAKRVIMQPEGFEEMKQIAAKLSKGIPHVRVDLYNINGHIYFGELTFSHWSGLVKFEPEEWDYKIGEWLSLPNHN